MINCASSRGMPASARPSASRSPRVSQSISSRARIGPTPDRPRLSRKRATSGSRPVGAGAGGGGVVSNCGDGDGASTTGDASCLGASSGRSDAGPASGSGSLGRGHVSRETVVARRASLSQRKQQGWRRQAPRRARLRRTSSPRRLPRPRACFDPNNGSGPYSPLAVSGSRRQI